MYSSLIRSLAHRGIFVANCQLLGAFGWEKLRGFCLFVCWLGFFIVVVFVFLMGGFQVVGATPSRRAWTGRGERRNGKKFSHLQLYRIKCNVQPQPVSMDSAWDLP